MNGTVQAGMPVGCGKINERVMIIIMYMHVMVVYSIEPLWGMVHTGRVEKIGIVRYL